MELSVAIVNDADGGGESQFQRPPADHQGILGGVNAAADHRVDVDVKIGVFRQQEQFAVEHLQALLGNGVRHDVVDGDLQMLQAGAIERKSTRLNSSHLGNSY